MGAQQSTMDAKSSFLADDPPPLEAPSAAAAATPAATSTENRPKPCCVCKEEKQKRDECMLFSTAKDPAADCASLVDQYKACMSGYGYKV